MITLDVALRQCIRLTGLANYPKAPEAQDEVVNALQRSARSPQHAAQIASEWLHYNRFAPTPADIYDIARKTDPETRPLCWECAECGGTGWKTVWQLATWRDGIRKDVEEIPHERYEELRQQVTGVPGEQMVFPAVRRCMLCAIGRRRAEAERTDNSA